jgi:hypothetical protein
VTRRKTSIALISGLFALSAVGAAIADEHEEPPAEESTAADVGTVWDDETHVLVLTIDDEAACDDVTFERDEEGNLVVMVGGEEVGDENPLPEGCLVFDGEGKDGKVNHGTIVSSVARNLSPHDLDGPKGHVMREVAKLKDFTMLKGEVDDDDEPGVAEDGGGERSGRPDHANGKAKGHSK